MSYTIEEMLPLGFTGYSGNKRYDTNTIRGGEDGENTIKVAANLSRRNPGVIIRVMGGGVWGDDKICQYFIDGERIPGNDVSAKMREFVSAFDFDNPSGYQVFINSKFGIKEYPRMFLTVNAAKRFITTTTGWFATSEVWFLIKSGEKIVEYVRKGLKNADAETYRYFVESLEAQAKRESEYLLVMDESTERDLPILGEYVQSQGISGLIDFMKLLNRELKYVAVHGNQEHADSIWGMISSITDIVDTFGS